MSWDDLANESGYRVFRDYLPAFTCSVPDCTHWLDTWSGTHLYEVQGFNVCGFGDVAGPESGTRLAPPPQVTGVSATDDHCDNIVISWNDVDNETAYIIVGDSGIQDTVDADVTVYVDVPPPGMYNYIVIAYNGCGNGPNSEFETGTRRTPVITIPALTSPIDGETVVSGELQLYCWMNVPGAGWYHAEWDDDPLFGSSVSVNTASNCYDQTLTSPLGTWYWRSRGENLCGPGPWSDVRTIHLISGTLEAPLVVVWMNGGMLRLAWNPVPNATSYEIVYATIPDGAYVHLTTVSDTFFAQAPPFELKRFFRVIALNEDVLSNSRFSPRAGELPEGGR